MFQVTCKFFSVYGRALFQRLYSLSLAILQSKFGNWILLCIFHIFSEYLSHKYFKLFVHNISRFVNKMISNGTCIAYWVSVSHWCAPHDGRRLTDTRCVITAGPPYTCTVRHLYTCTPCTALYKTGHVQSTAWVNILPQNEMIIDPRFILLAPV